MWWLANMYRSVYFYIKCIPGSVWHSPARIELCQTISGCVRRKVGQGLLLMSSNNNNIIIIITTWKQIIWVRWGTHIMRNHGKRDLSPHILWWLLINFNMRSRLVYGFDKFNACELVETIVDGSIIRFWLTVAWQRLWWLIRRSCP